MLNRLVAGLREHSELLEKEKLLRDKFRRLERERSNRFPKTAFGEEQYCEQLKALSLEVDQVLRIRERKADQLLTFLGTELESSDASA